MTELTYVFRASLLAKDQTFRFGADALHWQDEKVEGQMALAEIVLVRLIKFPSFGGDQHYCDVRDQSGAKVRIRSHHYKSMGAFEDRSETYVPFVRELILRVASASPQAKFIAGSSRMWYLWLGLLVLSVVVAVLLVMALLGGASLSGGIIGPIVVFAILGPGMWRLVRRGREREFDPDNPPAELLGV